MDATIDKFLQYIRLELNLSPHTVTAYGTDLDQWEQYLTQGKRQLDVASVTPSDIRAWMLWLNNNGVRETSVDSLLDSDIDMDDFEQVRNRLIVMMLYETGMRRAELIGLRDANVDTGKMELKVHGKRDKDRIIPFGTELAQWIDSYRRLRDQQAVGCDSFFVRPTGEPLYPMLVYRVVKELLSQAGVSSKRSPHVLRHTFATAMLNNGASLNSVKELLGHESLATTQIYTHVTFSELKNNYKLAHPRALKKGG